MKKKQLRRKYLDEVERLLDENDTLRRVVTFLEGELAALRANPLTHGTYDPDDDSTKTVERGYGEVI